MLPSNIPNTQIHMRTYQQNQTPHPSPYKCHRKTIHQFQHRDAYIWFPRKRQSRNSTREKRDRTYGDAVDATILRIRIKTSKQFAPSEALDTATSTGSCDSNKHSTLVDSIHINNDQNV